MDAPMVGRLGTDEGRRALAEADAVVGRSDALAAASALRAAGVDPDLAAAALTQATLRRRAAAKFGPDASRLLFTRAGLEQATRAVVADRRAVRLVAAGMRSVADLGCGIGADTLAFARAGLRITAVESDPVTAAVAEANVDACGYARTVSVVRGDATATDLSGVDAVFCDPARRDTARGRRVFDPAAYTPPWSFVAGLSERVPATVLKVAPGLDHSLIPPGVEAQWVSVGGDVVEAALWHGPLAAVPRRATVIEPTGGSVRREGASQRGTSEERTGPNNTGSAHELTGTGIAAAPVGTPRRFLYDPDGAVVRAHLVAEFASTVEGVLADARIAYVFGHTPAPTPFATLFEVRAQLPYGLKALRAALREYGIGALEIRKRGLAVDPDQLRRELRLAGGASATLVLTRIGTRPVAFLCQAVR